MEENAEIDLNGDEHVGESEEKKKKKRKLVRRRKKRDPAAEDDEEEEAEEDAAQLAAFEATKRQRRRSTLSLEVQKMSEGKTLTHFQAMAMLRKALIASFIKPPTGKSKEPEMKNTENRRLSDVHEVDQKMEGVNLDEKCLLLKSSDEKKTATAVEEEEKKEEKDGEEKSTAVKLVGQVAGKKSQWKIVEKQFIQGKDVSKNDAWKLIFLSDIFPKGSRGLQDLNAGSENENSASGDDYDSEGATNSEEEESDDV